MVLSNSRGPETLQDLVDGLGPDRAVLVIAGDDVGAKGEVTAAACGIGPRPHRRRDRTALAAAPR